LYLDAMADAASELLTTPGPGRKDLEPGMDLYRATLAAFVARRESPQSLNEWCRTQDPAVPRSTANAALLGAYESEELLALRGRILRACGLIAGRA
jgi:hypothetical protein